MCRVAGGRATISLCRRSQPENAMGWIRARADRQPPVFTYTLLLCPNPIRPHSSNAAILLLRSPLNCLQILTWVAEEQCDGCCKKRTYLPKKSININEWSKPRMLEKWAKNARCESKTLGAQTSSGGHARRIRTQPTNYSCNLEFSSKDQRIVAAGTVAQTDRRSINLWSRLITWG